MCGESRCSDDDERVSCDSSEDWDRHTVRSKIAIAASMDIFTVSTSTAHTARLRSAGGFVVWSSASVDAITREPEKNARELRMKKRRTSDEEPTLAAGRRGLT